MANEIKLFAGPSTNTLTPAAWAALTSLLANGFGSGLASSQQANTLFRQLSTVAAGVGQFISDQGFNALDNGNITDFATALANAIAKISAPAGMLVDFGFSGSIPGFIAADGSVPLISSVPNLAAAIYCGDANNNTASWGYKCTNPASPTTSRSTSGTYIVLLDARGRFRRSLSNGASLDSGRSLWAYQEHRFEDHVHLAQGSNTATGVGPGSGIMRAGGYTTTTGAHSGNFGSETRPFNYAATTYFKL